MNIRNFIRFIVCFIMTFSISVPVFAADPGTKITFGDEDTQTKQEESVADQNNPSGGTDSKSADKKGPDIMIDKDFSNKKRFVRIYAKDKSGVKEIRLYKGNVTSKTSSKWHKAKKIRDGKRYRLQRNEEYTVYAKDEVGNIRIKRFDSAKKDVFRITAYCGCRACNGRWAGQPTASGRRAVPGKTIAVDPSVISLGDKVTFQGHDYRADDTGSAIKRYRIDLYFLSHTAGNRWGVKYLKVKH